MSSLYTAAPFANSFSTLIHAQLALLIELLVTHALHSKNHSNPPIPSWENEFRLFCTPRTALSSSKCSLLFPRPSCLAPTSNSLIFIWKTLPIPFGNPKKLLSIAAAHTLCHEAPKAAGISLCSFDLSTTLAILIPNLASDASLHQVLHIYLLSEPVTTTPISVNFTSEQVDASAIKTSLPEIICVHPCISSILFIPPKKVLPCTSFKNSFCFQSILTAAFYSSEYWHLLINFIIHSLFHAILPFLSPFPSDTMYLISFQVWVRQSSLGMKFCDVSIPGIWYSVAICMMIMITPDRSDAHPTYNKHDMN